VTTPVHSIDLAIDILAQDSGLAVGCAAMDPPAVQSQRFTAAEAPKAIGIRIPQARPKVFSFTFPDAPVAQARQSKPINDKSPALPLAPSSPRESKSQTRIAPPGDVIKLQDRLYYVLQPPLETLLQSDALDFPFEPFAYQYQGVAFLYPRYSAILADEMGLGKTMQAITAMRMLLRAGEIKSVLLVCPKPLVTNWQREFGLWAPEIPLTKAAVAVDAGRSAGEDRQL
jgi:hypothetical protein